jgi:hypothetical protein
MFSKRKSFSKSRKFDREFLGNFVVDLRKSGFQNINFRLPHNLIPNSSEDLIDYEEFIRRGRNYPSVILIAENQDKNEIIKILFVNISRKTFFKDDTFPSGHSEPAELFVQSPDPARVYGLFGFFYDYLNKTPTIPFLIWLITLFSFIFLIAEFTSISRKEFLIDRYWEFGAAWMDIVALFFVFTILFFFFSQEGGLYVKEKETGVLSWTKRIIKGELRDNPLVNLLVTIIGGLIVVIIAKLLGF